MPVSRDKPILNKNIFWDVHFESLDYHSKATFVIERVFERGDVEDIRQCRRYYGDAAIKKTLLNTKYLPTSRLYLASAIINEPLNSFRCYTLRLLNPGLYPY